MDGMLALTIVCVVFAIGDFISDKTHAIIPVLLFASVTFLILFWTGVVPTTLFTDSGLIAISNMMTGIFIVNMGTLLDFKEFVSQWKTVVLGLAIVIVGGILMFFAARPVLGNNFAVALVGPITGGWVSAVVVNDAIKALGSPDSLKLAGVLATIIVAVQGIIGYPLAAAFLRGEAKRLVKGYNAGTVKATRLRRPPLSRKSSFPLWPPSTRPRSSCSVRPALCLCCRSGSPISPAAPCTDMLSASSWASSRRRSASWSTTL